MADVPPRSRLRGWRLIGLVVAAVLLLAVGAAAAWFRSDADLRAVDAELRAAGVPVHRRDAPGRSPADPERLACWERILALIAGKKSYASARSAVGRDPWPEFVPEMPVPAEMVAFYRDQDAAWLAALDAEVERLGSAPLVLQADITFATKMPEIPACRLVAAILAERAALAGPARDVRESVRRALAFPLVLERSALITSLVVENCAQGALRAAAARVDAISGPEAGAVRELLRRYADGWRGDLSAAFIGETMLIRSALDPGDRTFADLPPEVFGDGVGAFKAFYVRAGRADAIRSPLAAARAISAAASPRDAVGWARDQVDEYPSPWRPSSALAAVLCRSHSLAVKLACRRVVRAEALLAALDAAPPPDDPFDPAAGPLRPLRRPGGPVGWYSVGDNGVDDGGDAKKDVVVELGRVAAPAASAP